MTNKIPISEILSQEISCWKAKLETIAPPDEIGTRLFDAVGIFDQFKSNYSDFFLANLSKITAPPDWLFFRIEQTLLEYWEPIKRAARDYFDYPELIKNGSRELEQYKQMLEITRNIPAILYFDKVPRAVRLPFGPLFFIGIPLTDAYRGEWTAIPHELGHQVYWNSIFMINNSRVMPYQQQTARFENLIPTPKEEVFADLIEEVVAQPEWSQDRRQELKTALGQWSEEIFAEALGTLIAGKKFVDFAWQKVSYYVKRVEDADTNDGKHPKPYLLPFIRQCAQENPPDLRTYLQEAQERIFGGKEINNSEMDLLKALASMIGKLSNITNTLQPIIPSGYNPFERLREELPDDSTIIEKLLQPIILTDALTWTCACPADNNVCVDMCVNGVHTIPAGWLIFRPLVCG